MKKCADPVLCYTQGGARLFRHYSLASPIVRLHHQLVFSCGKCVFCRKKRAYELAVRCTLHASLHKQNSFVTLTYDEKRDGYHNKFHYPDIQLFKKKFRRFVDYHFERKVQVFNVHEYGKNGKKHWHLVVFGFDFSEDPDDRLTRRLYTVSGDHRIFYSPRLELLWPSGFNTVGSVTEASAMYQAQYTQKDIKNGNSLSERKAHSKHSGIGRDYFLRHYHQILSLGFIPVGGRRVPIPRYFLKLAHRHWCHFFEPSAFFDNKERKRLYAPFKEGEENLDLALCYKNFLSLRKEKIAELVAEWDDFIQQHAFSDEKPDFLRSAENYLYDLNNKKGLEEF